MESVIIPLREVIGSPVEPNVLNKIQEFSCKNSDVETFLKTKAYDFEKRHKSRTYLIIDLDSLDIVAYYTVSNKSLEFSDGVSTTVIKKIDGFSRSVKSIAVILIGQLGKNLKYCKKYRGAELLNYALNTVYEIRDRLGGRICLVETENSEENKKVIDFYIKNNFKKLQLDTSDNYVQMFLSL